MAYDRRYYAPFPRRIVSLMPPACGSDLFLLRHLLGIPRRLLALRAGVSDTTVAGWEKSPKSLSASASERVEHALTVILRAKARELARHGYVWIDLAETDLSHALLEYVNGVAEIDWTPQETFEPDYSEPRLDGDNAENDEQTNEHE